MDVSNHGSDARVIRRLIVAVALLVWLKCLSSNIVDPDLWGHVRYGQDLISTGRLPRVATYTYTATTQRWINHEILAEVCFAHIYATLGTIGLLTFKLVMAAAVLYALAWTARWKEIGSLSFWCCSLLVAINLHNFFVLRPQLFSFGFFVILLMLLEVSFRYWKQEGTVVVAWLWLTPPMFAVWINTHGGVIAGYCIFGAYLFGRSLEAVWRFGRTGVVYLAQFSAVIVACYLATMLNPYGTELHRWFLDSLIEARPEIVEWNPPNPQSVSFFPWILLSGVLSISLLYTQLKIDRTELLILFLTFWQSCSHLRHIAFLALLSGFWLPIHFQSALLRFNLAPLIMRMKRQSSLWKRRAVAFSISTVIGVLAVSISESLRELPVRGTEYPIDALEFMRINDLHGNAIVAFNWAQYAIAALSPSVKVDFDGRYDTCYPLDVVDMHFDFEIGDNKGRRNRRAESGRIDGTRILSFANPNLVLLDRNFANSVAVMSALAARSPQKWILLYQDARAQLWGLSDVYGSPDRAAHVARDKRLISDIRSNSVVEWPALP